MSNINVKKMFNRFIDELQHIEIVLRNTFEYKMTTSYGVSNENIENGLKVLEIKVNRIKIKMDTFYENFIDNTNKTDEIIKESKKIENDMDELWSIPSRWIDF